MNGLQDGGRKREPSPPPRRRSLRVVAGRARATRGTGVSSRSSAASAHQFLDSILVRVAENGFEAALVRCVDLCHDTRANVELWERVVDVRLHAADAPPMMHLTRLMHWAREGDLARVREALGRGASVNARDTFGGTPLIYAAGGGHADVMTELVDRGADVHALAALGTSALSVAAAQGSTEVVEELAAHGADVRASNAKGKAPLAVASINGHAAAADSLLRLGANVNARDHEGVTALMEASFGGHVDVVRVLLAAPGVDVNVNCLAGESALSVAREALEDDVVDMLVAAGAQ